MRLRTPLEFRRLQLLPRRLIIVTVLGGMVFAAILYVIRSASEENAMVIEMVEESRQVISMRRNLHSLSVAIVTILDENFNESTVAMALSSLQCYALMHGYVFEKIYDSPKWRKQCPHNGIMFRRHCIASFVLRKYEWILFVDADIGVINPVRLLEEYIDDKYEVILYERFFNFEIACGSYFAHNSQFGRRFLMQLADSEKTLPDAFHGKDNGAIHFVLLDTVYEKLGNDAIGCRKLWENSRDGADLYAAEVCARLLLKSEKVNSRRIKITRKGEGWVRDAFLTWSRWSRGHDFMIHGWKIDNLINETSKAINQLPTSFKHFRQPFTRLIFDMGQCETGSVKWYWNRNIIFEESVIVDMLRTRKGGIDAQFGAIYRHMVRRLQHLGFSAPDIANESNKTF